MPARVFISPLNTLHLVPEDKPQAAGVHTRFAEDSFFMQTVRAWESKRPAFSLIETGDIVSFQIDASTDQQATVYLYNERHQVVHTATMASPEMIAGNVYTNPAQYTEQWYTHTYSFLPAAIQGLTPGYYWLRVKFTWVDDAPQTRYVLSGTPLFISPHHRDTIRIDCTHGDNEKDFIFSPTNTILTLRIRGQINPTERAVVEAFDEDESGDIVPLSAHPFREWRLETDILPRWQHQALNHMLSCDSLAIENKRFARPAGAEWEAGEGRPQSATAITLRRTDAQEDHVHTWDTGTLLYKFPGTFPYDLHTLRLFGISNQLILSGRIIENRAQEQTLAGELNVNAKNVNRLYGEFIERDGGLYYVPHVFEPQNMGSLAIIHPYFYTMEVDMTASVTLGSFSFESTNTTLTVDWGQGGSVTRGGVSGIPVTQTQGHSYGYPVNGTFNVRVFHNDTQLKLKCTNPQLKSITGRLPALQDLDISGSQRMTSFGNLGLLAPCVTSMHSLKIYECPNLASFTGMQQPWTKLSLIQLHGNKLPVQDVSFAAYDYVTSAVTIPAGGDIEIQGQTPPAPPNPAGLAAIDTLTNTHGWGAIHD